MKAIIGTFCTTALSALQIETSLPPTDLRLRNHVLQSWTRMQTAPETHPINFAIRRAISSQSMTSITPFEHLARMFPNHATPIETIKPYPVPLWWSPPFTIEIDSGNKKSAKSKHDATFHDDNTLCMYTDGSGINGHVGAAAVSQKISRTLRRYLGSDKEHNVYTAEVTGFELAAEIALSSPLSYTKCVIYADSKAAIQGINKPGKQSGQANLISAIGKLWSLVDNRQMTMEIKWAPGHKKIDGNEEADEAAKEAAQSGGNDSNIPRSTHAPLKSVRSVCIK